MAAPPDDSRRSAFSRQLVEALASARSAAAAPPPPDPSAAWRKLQFDFPLLQAAEVEALHRALREGGAQALRAHPLTEPLAHAVWEGARRRGAATTAPEQLALRRAYQRLAAQLFASVPLLLLRSGLSEAARTLSSLHLPPEEGAESERSVEVPQEEPAAVEEPQSGGYREVESDAGSDDSDWEPLQASAHATHPEPGPSHPPPAAPVHAKLRWLVEKAEHRCFELSGVWKEAGLSHTLLQLLQTSSALEDAAASAAVHSACASAFAERWCAEARARAQVDETLSSVLQALQEDAGLSLWALGRLCSAAGGAGGWEEGAEDVAGPAAAAAVWPHVHACLDVVVAPQAERLASAASSLRRALDKAGPAAAAPTGAELDAAASLGRLIAFYATHAPGGADAGEHLLRCGALRSGAAALAASPTPLPALRRGLLLVAAASAPACAFLAAVPGCAAAMGAEGCAEGALWPLVRDGDKGDATRLVAALDAESAALPETLSLLRDAMRCAGAARKLWSPGDAVHSALLALQAWLRAQGGVGAGEEGVGAEGKRAERNAVLRAALKGVLGESGKAD